MLRSAHRVRLQQSVCLGAVHGPGARIPAQFGALFSASRAEWHCSRRRRGWSLRCQLDTPQGRRMNSGANQASRQPSAPLAGTSPLPGKRDAASGSSIVDRTIGFWPNWYSNPAHADTSKSGEHRIGGSVRLPVRSWGGPSSAVNPTPRPPPVVSLIGLPTAGFHVSQSLRLCPRAGTPARPLGS